MASFIVLVTQAKELLSVVMSIILIFEEARKRGESQKLAEGLKEIRNGDQRKLEAITSIHAGNPSVVPGVRYEPPQAETKDPETR